jgi:hypothetical protein
MVILDRIRLTGLLTESPAQAGLSQFYGEGGRFEKPSSSNSFLPSFFFSVAA